MRPFKGCILGGSWETCLVSFSSAFGLSPPRPFLGPQLSDRALESLTPSPRFLDARGQNNHKTAQNSRVIGMAAIKQIMAESFGSKIALRAQARG